MKEICPVVSGGSENMKHYEELVGSIPDDMMAAVIDQVFMTTPAEYVETFIRQSLSIPDSEKDQLITCLRNIYLLREKKDA